MIIERPENSESMSISFKAWLLQIADYAVSISGYKGRSDFVLKACRKQMIFQTKIGDLIEILKDMEKNNIDPGEKKEITISVPAGFLKLLERHCLNYSCDMETQFFFIAALKYLLMKEDPEDFFEQLYEKMHKDEKSVFKAIII